MVSQPKNFLVKNLKQLGIVQLLSNIAINSDMAMLFKWASRTSISFFIFRGVEVGASQVMLFPSVLTYAFCLLCTPYFTMHTLHYYARLTLLCSPYFIMHTLPYYAHFTLLCTPYLTVHTLPYFLHLPEYQIIAPLFRLCLQ